MSSGVVDVPVGAAFFGNRAKVLAEIFQGGAAEEPIAIVDLINDKTGLENNHARDHGILKRVGVLGDVEIFLDYSARVGKERPVGADAAAILTGLGDIVGADGDQPAIRNFELTMELHKQFSLATVLGAEASAAEDENHGMLRLEFGELPAFGGMPGNS